MVTAWGLISASEAFSPNKQKKIYRKVKKEMWRGDFRHKFKKKKEKKENVKKM